MVKVIFVHPDLGIGGAERLVLDAALAFRSRGHDVTFYTNHFDYSHCFGVIKEGLFKVNTVGNWMPTSIFGKCKALCAYLRIVYLAINLALYVIPSEHPKIIFCDLISIGIPFLKLAKGSSKIVYYCHHPDKLLTSKGGFMKTIYRFPLDRFEEIATSLADKVLVNSKYTAAVYKDAFPTILNAPEICYPSINTGFFETVTLKSLNQLDIISIPAGSVPFLSINRYVRNKNLALALEAFAELQNLISESNWKRIHLIMAGGYDPNCEENKKHYTELVDFATRLGITDKVTFLKSPGDEQKASLLHNCKAMIYTPSNEHFGICPIEAMYFGKPVIAVNSGGPTETIVNGVNGFLCEAKSSSFAAAMEKIIMTPELAENFGKAGKERFEKMFSFDAFSVQINNLLLD